MLDGDCPPVRQLPLAAPKGALAMLDGLAVRVVSAGSLERAELERWAETQGCAPSLASPYFSPEYTRLIARARPDVRVGLLEAADGPVGFFPFHPGRLGVGAPVGWPITDYHGVIAQEGVRVDVVALLRASGLTAWPFRHVPAAQTAFERFARARCDSAVIDISSGFEEYARQRREAGSHIVASLGQKERKLAREHGPVSYVEHTPDPGMLDLLMEWKTRQYRRTGAINALGRRWVREVLRLAHGTQGEAFAGVLSLLCTDGRPVAMHLGIRSRTVLHSWFPTYDPTFARYSPGQILFLKMAESAPAPGIRAIDLGPGTGQHKAVMKNSGSPLLEGIAEVPSLTATVVRASRTARALVHRSPMAGALRPVVRSGEALRR
jgi:CelD/BcsL family acetyltransferase involved in cellulose biosynthesis